MDAGIAGTEVLHANYNVRTFSKQGEGRKFAEAALPNNAAQQFQLART